MSYAQLNPNGYIRTEAWNLLFLDQPNGANGGGPANMKGNWVAPHDLGAEDPKAGDVWADIAFGAGALARGWTATSIGVNPTWTAVNPDGTLATDPTKVNLSRGDVVDFNAIISGIGGFSNDNVLSIATTYVRNTTGANLTVQLGTASDDGIQLYVNDELALTKSDARGTISESRNFFEEWTTVVLPPGISRIVAMVWEGGGGHALRLGLIIDGVRVKDGNGKVDFLGTGVGDAAIVGQANPSKIARSNNPFGWILAKAWNFLGPLDNPGGSVGGGELNMIGNWTTPFDVRTSDPKSGDVWAIDYPQARSSGNAMAAFTDALGLGADPIWYTFEDLVGLVNLIDPTQTAALANISGEGTDPFGRGLVDLEDWLRLVNARVAVPNAIPTIDGKVCDNPADYNANCDPDNIVIIATTYVRNKTNADLPMQVAVSSDDSAQVYVNCELVANISHDRGSDRAAQNIRPFALPPGISKIAVLTFEGGGGFNFRCGLIPDGAIDNISDGNAQVEFLGNGDGDDAIVGTQDAFCIDRLAALAPFNCPNDEVEYTLLGNGKGDPAAAIKVVESIVSVDLDQVNIKNISHGGAVNRTVVNAPYINTSSSGHDIWADCDDFQFDYAMVTGDFDVSIEFLYRGHSDGPGTFSNASNSRWGKFGLMAREKLDRTGLYDNIQDHLPDRRDSARTAVRRNAAGGDTCDTTAEAGTFAKTDHPRFLRIKRQGARIRTFFSNKAGLADGTLDPTNDANWLNSSNQDWPGTDVNLAMPDDLFVGFSNSEHGSGGAGLLKVAYRILPGSDPDVFDNSTFIGNDAGGRSMTQRDTNITTALAVEWNTTRASVNEGLKYTVDNNLASAVTHDFNAGFELPAVSRVVGGPVVNPTPESFSVSFNPNTTGPIGMFDNSHDIGNPPSLGSTTFDAGTGEYTVSGSGADIWDGGDQMQFAYKAVSGDFVATARVTDAVNPPNARWGRYGWMARYTCDANSKYSMACIPFRGEDVNNNDSRRHQSRRDHLNNGTTRDNQIVPAGSITQQNTGWVRLTRIGNFFFSQFADDVAGEPGPWVYAGGDTHSNPPSTLLLGLVSSSHGTAGANQLKITYDNVSIAPPELSDLPCSKGEPVLADDFELALDPNATRVIVGAGAYTPATIGGRLRVTQDGIGGSGTGVWFNADGLGLGDTGFVAEFDGFYGKSGGGADPADGFTFAVVEGTFDSSAGLLGDAGGSAGYNAGDHNAIPPDGRRRKSFAVEIDNWDGGHGDNDPPGQGANGGNPDENYHVGIDINFDTQSEQNNVELGQTLPVLFNNASGAHFEVQYNPNQDPATSTGQIDVWMTANDGSFPRTKVLSAKGPLFVGDVFLGFTGGTGGANADAEFDNFVVSSLCCEQADTVAIEGPSAPPEGQPDATLMLTAVTGGNDGGAQSYKWTVAGSAQIVGPDNQSTVQIQCTGEGASTVSVVYNDGICSDSATADHEISCAPLGARRIANDCNKDSGVDISDPVCLLGHLFLGDVLAVECGEAGVPVPVSLPAIIQLLDANGDGGVDISDPVAVLGHLFLGDPPPANGPTTSCILIPGCQGNACPF